MAESEIFLVNATNVLLGLLTVGCWIAVLAVIGLELRRRVSQRLF